MKYVLAIVFFTSSFFNMAAQEIELNGQLKIINGSEGSGKVLTSDSVGVASWISPSSIPYPVDPSYLFKSEINVNNKDWIKYQRPIIDSTKIVVGGIDLTLSDNFIAWAKIGNVREDRMSISSNGGLDAFNFLIIEEGIHTIDGKMIQAGRAEDLAQLGTVTFNQAFDSPPIVFIMLDETTEFTGSTILNIWGGATITNNTFQIWKNSGFPDDIFWVAMEEGTYTTDKWKWYAHKEAIGSSGNPTYNFPVNFFSRTPDGFGCMEGVDASCRLKDSDKASASFNYNYTTSVASHMHILFWEEIY